jgi:hypothetical protein
MTRGIAALVLAPVLLAGCSGGAATPVTDPDIAASAPVPGLTLPPDALSVLVPQPDEVPAGMVPLPAGSGPRDITVVAGYSGTGAAAGAAQTKLRSHGFVKAYVAQYASQATGQVLSIVVSEFATAAGATADFKDDLVGAQGKTVPSPTLGEQSAITLQDMAGSVSSQLVLVRFRRGTHTWSLAYQAAPTAEPRVAIDLATRLLARTAT